jgi:hypothetical protein
MKKIEASEGSALELTDGGNVMEHNSNDASTTNSNPSAETAQAIITTLTTEGMFSLANFAMAAEQFGAEGELVQGPLAVRNPSKMEYIRVNGDPAYRARVCILIDQRNETTFLVAPTLRSALEGDVATAELVLAANQDGETFLWLAKLPAYDGEPFGTTRAAAISLAKTAWVRLRIRADRKGYDVIRAAGTFPDPQWPAKSLDELCRESFADRFVGSLDHPVLRRLRGEAA